HCRTATRKLAWYQPNRNRSFETQVFHSRRALNDISPATFVRLLTVIIPVPPPTLLVSDLDRLICHPLPMIFNRVTPMHHLTIVGSSVASGLRRQEPVWRLSAP